MTVPVENLGWIAKSAGLMASLTRARTYATQQQHREVTLEHVLLALTEDTDALMVLGAAEVNIEKLRSAVSDLIGRNDDRIFVPDLGGPYASSDLVKIFEYASAAADQSGRQAIDGAIILAALIGEGESSAARLLETNGLTFETAIASLQSMTPGDVPSEAAAPNDPQMAGQPAPQPPSGGLPNADSVTKPATGPAKIEARFAAAAEPQPSTTDAPPPPPPMNAPAAPPPQVPQGQPGNGISQSPPPARRGLNDRTGSPGTTPHLERRIGAGAPAPTPTPVPPAPVGQPKKINPSTRTHDFAAENGAIAPWPDPETAAPPPLPGQIPPNAAPARQARPVDTGGMRGGEGPSPVAGQSRQQADSGAAPVIDEGKLIENIPRKMRVGISEQIEIRIARASVEVPTTNMQGQGQPQSHNLFVTKAMTVRLRAPEGGMRIETSSPETQWIDNALGLIQDDFASWRWTVTPEIRGLKRLQLVVSARTVGADGLTAETALPDQVFDIAIRMNYVRTAGRLAGWAAVAAAGGVVTAFGEDAYRKVLELVNLI